MAIDLKEINSVVERTFLAEILFTNNDDTLVSLSELKAGNKLVWKKPWPINTVTFVPSPGPGIPAWWRTTWQTLYCYDGSGAESTISYSRALVAKNIQNAAETKGSCNNTVMGTVPPLQENQWTVDSLYHKPFNASTLSSPKQSYLCAGDTLLFKQSDIAPSTPESHIRNTTYKVLNLNNEYFYTTKFALGYSSLVTADKKTLVDVTEGPILFWPSRNVTLWLSCTEHHVDPQLNMVYTYTCFATNFTSTKTKMKIAYTYGRYGAQRKSVTVELEANKMAQAVFTLTLEKDVTKYGMNITQIVLESASGESPAFSCTYNGENLTKRLDGKSDLLNYRGHNSEPGAMTFNCPTIVGEHSNSLYLQNNGPVDPGT